jgi:hypothetical protein
MQRWVRGTAAGKQLPNEVGCCKWIVRKVIGAFRVHFASAASFENAFGAVYSLYEYSQMHILI